MERVPRIRARRLVEEQDRIRGAEARDQDAPNRLPVEVLANQMRLYGMHGTFREGSSRVALQQVRDRVGRLYREPEQQDLSGLATVHQLGERFKCSKDPIYTYMSEHRIKAVRKVNRAFYYRLADFDGFKVDTTTQPKGITLPDGRHFRSINDVARSMGRGLGFIHNRLKILNLPPTPANVWLVMHEKPTRKPKHHDVIEWCETNGIRFDAAKQRCRWHGISLSIASCQALYAKDYVRRADSAKETQPDQPIQPGHAVGGSHGAMECHEWREAHHYAGGA